MATTHPTLEFQFVNSTITSPTVPQDAEVRALIRKQAMRKASLARKRDGNYGKHNLRQYPVFIYEQDNGISEVWGSGKLGTRSRKDGSTKSITKSTDAVKETKRTFLEAESKVVERQRWLKKLALVETVSPCLSAEGYELKSIQTDFDILDLSTLATLHIGRTVRGALSANPYQLVSQLRAYKRWSYLSFLPTRYEHIQCLRDGTDCVIARARQIVCPNKKWETVVIAFYVRALESLQKAIDGPQRYQPEVLCATEILALYELLDPNGETGWVKHSAGAAKLIQVRSPRNYDTEFEKALFMAQTVPMTECLLKNEHCFLAQPPWQPVWLSVIDSKATISDRSEAVVSLLMNKCQIPGCAADVTSLICTDTPPPVSSISQTKTQIRQLRQNFLNWKINFDLVVKKCTDMEIGSQNHDSYAKVYANYLSCIIITSRLSSALCSPEEREELEVFVQAKAREMFELEEGVGRDSPTSLFMAQTMAVALSVVNTKDDWVGGGDVGAGVEIDDTGAGVEVGDAEVVVDFAREVEIKEEFSDVEESRLGLIERGRLERWCVAFGRIMP